MNIIPTQNVWFDDAATFAMGEAFDNACKSFQNFGSAVPAIIANLIIAAAKKWRARSRPRWLRSSRCREFPRVIGAVTTNDRSLLYQ